MDIGKVVYRYKEYIVIEDDYRAGEHIIINTNGRYENHGHVKFLGTCKKLLGLIERNIVPDSTYLRETALRISLDKDYKSKVRSKIEKDKQRQRYFNPQKGVRR